MASSTASSTSQRNMTSTTAVRRAEVSCVLSSRSGCTNTRHSTATMTMAEDDGSKWSPSRMIVAYSDATATSAGIMACAPANRAIRKLCFARTGWVMPQSVESSSVEMLIDRS